VNARANATRNVKDRRGGVAVRSASSAAGWDRADRTSADQLSRGIKLADGHLDRLPGLEAELVNLSVDATVTARQAR